MARTSIHLAARTLAMAEALREPIKKAHGKTYLSRSEVIRRALDFGLEELCRSFNIHVTPESNPLQLDWLKDGVFDE